MDTPITYYVVGIRSKKLTPLCKLGLSAIWMGQLDRTSKSRLYEATTGTYLSRTDAEQAARSLLTKGIETFVCEKSY